MKLINMTYTGVKGHAVLTSQAWPFAAAHKSKDDAGEPVVDFYVLGVLHFSVNPAHCSVEFAEGIQRKAIETQAKRKERIRSPRNVSSNCVRA